MSTADLRIRELARQNHASRVRDLGGFVAETPRERSERLLAAMGFAVEAPADVEAVCRLLAGVLTSGGHERRVRLESCGVAFPVLRPGDELLTWERRGCKDRFCPSCAESLSHERAKLVRDHWESRRAAGSRGVFVTLTRPKRRMESARSAVRSCLDSWRKIAHGETAAADGLIRSRTKRAGAPMLPGGLRSLEVTARAPNTVLGSGEGRYEVKVGGTHAHLHIVAELAEGRTPGELAQRLITAWREVTGASAGAQDVQLISDRNIYQATKYAADLGALARLVDVAPGYAKSVAEALHGVRTQDCWGQWRGILKPEPSGVFFADRSIASLVLNSGGRVQFGPHRSEPATEVLASIAAGAERYKDVRGREVEVAWDIIRERLEVEKTAMRAAGLL